MSQILSSTTDPLPAVGETAIQAFGVVGAGLMASQLVLLIADKLRIPVKISDLSADRVAAALGRMRAHLERQEAKGKLLPGEAAEISSLITGTTDIGEFGACDATIEAVFEELSVKRSVFQQLEEFVRPDALLLTNTSSLSVASMARGLQHPERLLGFHFFNPVAILPLVELIGTPYSAEAAMAEGRDLALRLGKTAVRVADKPGFVVNRLLTRLFCEVLDEIDKGGDQVSVDNALAPWGLPMTPLNLIKYIGPAVQRHICDTLHRAYPGRFIRSASLDALVDAGLPGFFDQDGRPHPEVAANRPGPYRIDAGHVRRRVRDALSEEAQHMLNEGVVASFEDIDRCMTLGANFPAGGLTRLLST